MPGTRLRILLSLFLLGLCGVVPVRAEEPAQTGDAAFSEQDLEFFEKQVRPILKARCTECHGAGSGDPKGGLRLDSRAGALQGGDTGPAVVPGKPRDSLLVSAIEYGDLYQMPPKSKLPAEEIAILTRWVERGAPWPKEAAPTGTVKPFDLAARRGEHWCWQPITNPPVPQTRNSQWPLTDIDRFLLAQLEANDLTPAPAADRRTLLRRITFDLIGLPPAPDEMTAFLQDDSPEAIGRVVDRLLDSVHFGERWARHWLDLVRYAETRGHEFEPSIPNAWQYRDYVIRALNSDVPYDRFLKEHIAGDLLEPRWRAQNGSADLRINEGILGTGFWFLGEEVHSPVDIRKDETDRMDNRLDVMSKTFLGLTVACARCHDHKFDAISQRDYYALTGYLISSGYRQVRLDTQARDAELAQALAQARGTARAEIRRVLADRLAPQATGLAKLLDAAREAVETDLAAGWPSGSGRVEQVFADFENDQSYGDWKAEGTAFGDRPPRKEDNQYNAPLVGYRGVRLVNSHRNGPESANDAATRDAHVGRLISPEFPIRHPEIHFLIGGGEHPGRTCLNLEVDGKVVRTETGHNSGSLRAERWNVADLRGKTGRLVIVDDVKDGWGHLLVDQIVFSGEASATDSSDDPVIQTLRARAAARQLDPDQFLKCCRELLAARQEAKHVLHRYMTRVGVPALPTIAADSIVVDFSAPRPGDSIQDGVSFGTGPVPPGELVFLANGPRIEPRLAAVGGWERDLFWKSLTLTSGSADDHGTLGTWQRHGRSVRTPEFSLREKNLWYLVRGSIRAYACVNSHLVVAGPLHGSILREYKHADQDWHWVQHGMDLYQGNRLHVEFVPADQEPCAVAMVVQSDRQPPLPTLQILEPANLPAEVTQAAAVIAGRATHAPSATLALADWMLRQRDWLLTPLDQQVIADCLARLQSEEERLTSQVRWDSQLAPAMLDGNGIDEHLLVRGNSNTPRDPVPRRFLEALGGNAPDTAYSGRLQLAQQMIDSPLAARVQVNRVWHHLFGRGLVPSVDNMGVLGQPPTHPELLDALATQFIQDGWSTKRLIRRLILTRTYQMSSRPVEPAESRDPKNLFWHRMPVKRLEGEVIRDSLLAVSGRLDRKTYGPSVPIHLTPFMEGRGRPGVSGPLDGDGRRSIYIAVRRNFLSPMMLAFDTPAPFSTVGRRTVSNVPAQALILMNDPLVLEQARRWAERLLAAPTPDASARVALAYQIAFGRPPTAEETQDALAFLDAQGERLQIPAAQRSAAPASWTDLCHVLFNLKEFVFVE